MKKYLICIAVILLPLFGFTQSLEQRINSLLSQMSTTEKVEQLINNTFFTTGDNTRLGIPGFQMSDGPHGVRFGGATSFPTGISMAASWDIDLIEQVGRAMGEEFWAHGKHQQLGPCIDLCRDPRNGRSPESAGEDPFLAGEIAAAVIKGIQQTPVIATAKHFNLVNKQQYRNNSNVTISDRWLMEHYGHDFRMAVQEGGVLSVMNAYNLINGDYCSESKNLLQSILREQWGFPFYVVSDWGAVHNSKKAIEAGTDICMGSAHYENDLENLLNSASISEAVLNDAVRKVLRTKMLAGMLDNYPRPPAGLVNSDSHKRLALEAAQKVLVLLKNEDQILPLNRNSINKLALIGPSANKAQLDGFGSSWVEPIYTVSPRQGINTLLGSEKVFYSYGCDINSSDTTRFAAARQVAANADVVIYIGGLDDTQEGEGYGDRPEYDRAGGSIQLPGKQQDLIIELSKVNDNLIVIIESGGICGLNRCIDNINALIYAFYPGQEGGNAIAETLFGLNNPGGKLPVTMPKSDSQLPPWNDNFNDDFGCGYRWYDEMNITPQYAFGYGLSYTEFAFDNLLISSSALDNEQAIEVSVDVTNIGAVAGEEVLQLYLEDVESSIWMPEKQLKGFDRVFVNPGETKTVIFELTAEDFYFWDETSDSYTIEAGRFIVKIGNSSDNLTLQSSFDISSQISKPDLKISKLLSIPRYPVEGDTVSLLAMVRNLGNKAIGPGELVKINFLLQEQLVASALYSDLTIPVGGMQLIEVNEKSWIADQPGIMGIVARVDPDNSIQEVIENNNSYTHSIEIKDSLTLILETNLALFKPVSASSSEGPDLIPEKAVDGSIGTRWSSLFSDPQEFMVDLENLYDLLQIRIHWEAAYSKEFIISVSEDFIDWTDVIIENNSDGNIDEFAVDTRARYIKFMGLKRATQWGHSFYEFEVFGKLHESPNSTDEAESSILDQIELFPNPAVNKLSFSHLNTVLPLDFRLFEIGGQLVESGKISSNDEIILSECPQGVYILELQYGNSKKSFKVLKQ